MARRPYYVESILGHAIGDAMGVPTEFRKRKELLKNPVLDMTGHGSYDVPAGYWSDDTSMEIATIDSFIKNGGFNYDDIMIRFLSWVQTGEYTPAGSVFDIGRTCLNSIRNYQENKSKDINFNPCLAGADSIDSNGNGSLMRILPVALYAHDKNLSEGEIILLTRDISSLTHRHEISILGCYIYVRYVMLLIDGIKKEEAYKKIQELDYSFFTEDTIEVYNRILKSDISKLDLSKIKSSGYIVDTLEACLWMILNCESYSQAVLGAINLGEDTDTIGAIVGSMAGLIYGVGNIPKQWIEKLARKDYIIALAVKFDEIVNRGW